MLSALAQALIEKEPLFDRTHVAIQWKDVAACVSPFLDSVRQELLSQSQTFIPELTEVFTYALSGQGKLLRPALFGLSGLATGGLGEGAVQAATAIEMIHLASLVHDDVIDEAQIRRKQPTLSRLWGNRTAVLLGDCILSQAALLSLQLNQRLATQKILSSSREVCLGETLQSLHTESILSQEKYFHIIALKTGELFALASELGALFAGASSEVCSLMRRFGLILGTTYQVYDDCVDIFSSEKVSGKSLGRDLSLGKQTLPIILLQKRVSASEAACIGSLLENWSPERTRELSPFLEKYSILESCVSIVKDDLEEALRIVRSLAPSEAQQGLFKLLEFLSQQFGKLTTA